MFRDAFPRIRVCEQIFVIDRDLVTAAGGVAALDLMLALIGRAHGPRLAQVVTNAFVHNQPRPAETPQRTDAAHGFDNQTVLRRAVRMMTEHIEFRIGSLEEIRAEPAGFAKAAGADIHE